MAAETKKRTNSLVAYGPKINTIYLHLKNYKYFHSSSNIDKPDHRIIGRTEISRKLLNLLKSGETHSGTYLITGSRGMGKTSVVNNVLRQWIDHYRLRWRGIAIVWVLSLVISLCLVLVKPEAFSLLYSSLFLGMIMIGLIIPFWRIFNYTRKKGARVFFKGQDDSWWSYILLLLLNSLAIAFASFYEDYYFVLIIDALVYWVLFIIYAFALKREDVSWQNLKSRLIQKRPEKIISVNLDIGQEDIDEVRVLKQIVTKLGDSCRDLQGQYGIFRATLIWFLAVTITCMIGANIPVGQGSKVFEISQSEIFIKYFPSQKIVWHTPIASDKLELSKVSIGNGVSIGQKILNDTSTQVSGHINAGAVVEYGKKGPEPTESIGWILHNVNQILISVTQMVDEMISAISAVTFKKLFASYSQERTDIPNPNYILIGFLLAIFFAIKLGIRILLNRLSPVYYKVGLLRVNELMNRIYAETSEIAVSGIPNNKFFNWSRKRTLTLPFAGKYEIQMEVQNIVRTLNLEQGWFPFIPVKRQFVFIMDELDKIEPDKYYRESASNSDTLDTRQERIIHMIQALKSFFNNTQAKFIFIAGDDMYDAAIADASNNREHSVDRLFNKVFYIPSFYSDVSDKRGSNINSMTESYVSKLLIEGYSRTSHEYADLSNVNLSKYYELLFRRVNHTNFATDNSVSIHIDERCFTKQENGTFQTASETDQLRVIDPEVLNHLSVKLIYTLSNFITYLSYQSNGSPKKITSLFEEYIARPIDLSDEKYRTIITLHSNGNCSHEGEFYLRFTEEDQYKFGLINYLVTPFLTNQKRYLRSFGDKLRVSTSFIVDHIYKYHDTAFSWKNLELTPEIISVNKAPQLREFIKDIMFHFNQTHIDRITSGLFDFKFIGKIKSEIRYLSKVSDLEAAAFNFTLDESRQTKIHYKQKLTELREVYKNRISNSSELDQKFIHSLTFTNMVLGDLEYYDQEYDNALIHYLDALQELRYLVKRKEGNQVYNFVLYLRNSLKLGLTLEKQNNYDSALMTYDTLKQEILNLRNLSSSDVGYKEQIIPLDKMPYFIAEQIELVGLNDLFHAFKTNTEKGAKLWQVINAYLQKNKDINYSSLDKMLMIELNDGGDKRFREKGGKRLSTEEVNLLMTWQTIIENYELIDEPSHHGESILLLPASKDQLRRVVEQDIESKVLVVVIYLFYQLYKPASWEWKENGLNPRITVITDEEDRFFSFQGNQFIQRYLIQDQKDEDRIKVSSKLFTFKNLRLMYQPFIASLSLLEKNGINSITRKDVENTIRDFNFITKLTNIDSAYMIEVEFLNKIGDVLYFKNGMLKNSIIGDDNKSINKKLLAEKLLSLNTTNELRDYNLPFNATVFYLLSIQSFRNGIKFDLKANGLATGINHFEYDKDRSIAEIIDEQNTGQFYKFYKVLLKQNSFEPVGKLSGFHQSIISEMLFGLEYLNQGVASPNFTNPRSIKINTLANCFSDLGDSILSSLVESGLLKGKSSFLLERLDNLLDLICTIAIYVHPRYFKKEQNPQEKVKQIIIDLNPYSLEGAFILYLISSALYTKTEKHLKAGFEIKKMLTIIDDCLFINENSQIVTESIPPDLGQVNVLLMKIEEFLLMPYVQQINEAYQNSSWQDMGNYKVITGMTRNESSLSRVMYGQKIVEGYLKRKFYGENDVSDQGLGSTKVDWSKQYHSKKLSSILNERKREFEFISDEIKLLNSLASLNDVDEIERIKKFVAKNIDRLSLYKTDIESEPKGTFIEINKIIYRLEMFLDALNKIETYPEWAVEKKKELSEIITFIRENTLNNEPNIDFEFYKHSSIHSEHREAYVIFEKIKARLLGEYMVTGKFDYSDISRSSQSNPYSDNSNQMNRAHELSLRGIWLKKYYTHQKFGEYNSKNLPEEDIKEDIKNVYSDAIYCHNEIISKLNVLEPGFQLPHMYFGFAHQELAWWLSELENLPEIQFQVFNELEGLSEDKETDFLNKEYQWSRAKYHFLKAMQMHTGMDSYTHALNSMYYLDDDFNDDQEHFYAAQERFHINAQFIKRLTSDLNGKLKTAEKLFGSEFYSESFIDDGGF